MSRVVRWLHGAGADLREEPDEVTFRAGGQTDWFRDPRGAEPAANAPVAVVADGDVPATVSCTVRVPLPTTFDAAGLFAHWDDEHWVKLAVELDPAGTPRIVTVRTDGTSDDGNHRPIDPSVAELRMSVDDRSIAMHARAASTEPWELIRYASHPTTGAPSIGLIVQSPLGDGIEATFTALTVERRSVDELRDGS